MKIKTSVALPEDLLRQLDELASQFGNRSAVIERAIREFIAAQEKKKREARDLAILNQRADKLNSEAEDVLLYQVDV